MNDDTKFMNVINQNLVKIKRTSKVSSLLVLCVVTGMLTGQHGILLLACLRSFCSHKCNVINAI